MMDDDDLQRVYQWVDEIPLSRPKRNIARDFADGVLTAEIVAHYFPRLIEIHNYPPANSYSTKMYNWCVFAWSLPSPPHRPAACRSARKAEIFGVVECSEDSFFM